MYGMLATVAAVAASCSTVVFVQKGADLIEKLFKRRCSFHQGVIVPL
jgi:hypothetical protein